MVSTPPSIPPPVLISTKPKNANTVPLIMTVSFARCKQSPQNAIKAIIIDGVPKPLICSP